MLSRLGNKKRSREKERTPVPVNDFKLTSEANEIDINSASKTSKESIELEKMIEYLKQLGSDFKTQLTTDIYLKLEVDIAQSRYFEENQDKISETLKGNFKITELSLSPSVVGSIDRYITLSGQLHTIMRAALYLSYISRSELNNIMMEPITLKTQMPLTVVLADKMSSERIGQIERRAKFTSVPYYDLMTPTHFQSTGSILKLAVTGNCKTLFDFLAHIVETSEFSSKYLDDSLILQYPVIKADDSSLFQRQEINASKLQDSIKDALIGIFGKEYIEKNHIV